MRVKICGVCSVEDAVLAAEAGADAIGLVFHSPSPRAVSPAQAAAIWAALPPFVSAVGVFVDATAEEIEAILATCPLELLQFHGEESSGFCQQFQRRFIKSVAMGPEVDIAALNKQYAPGRLLLDTRVPGQAGGTGVAFNWHTIPPEFGSSVLLAGGLTAENIGEAVRRVQPYAVDVSSGVEERAGVKSPERVQAFIQGVQDAIKIPAARS